MQRFSEISFSNWDKCLGASIQGLCISGVLGTVIKGKAGEHRIVSISGIYSALPVCIFKQISIAMKLIELSYWLLRSRFPNPSKLQRQEKRQETLFIFAGHSTTPWNCLWCAFFMNKVIKIYFIFFITCVFALYCTSQ